MSAKSTKKTHTPAPVSVLIIGSSHVGAPRTAKDSFQALYPEIELSFFAAPGTSFTRGRLDKNNVFIPKVFSDRDTDTVVQINGTDSVSLDAFDHVLIIGHRPQLLDLCGLGGDDTTTYGLLDQSEDGAQFLSRELVEDWLDHILDPWVEKMASIFGKRDGLCFTDAPHRSISMLEIKDQKKEARMFDSFQAIPFLAELMQIYDQKITKKLADHGYGFFSQPDHTIATPFATVATYCHGGKDGAGNASPPDHRHMNPAFGLELLTTYATTQLGLPDRASNG